MNICILVLQQRFIGGRRRGCDGFGLEISAEGEILRGMPNKYGSAEGKMDAFVSQFPAFERDFLAFVERLTNNF